MNRVDLALGELEWTYPGQSPESIAADGRRARRQTAASMACAMHHQSMPIRLRVQWWRRVGEPKGHPFAIWSPWVTEVGWRRQAHLTASRGSAYAARQIALFLVCDLREAA